MMKTPAVRFSLPVYVLFALTACGDAGPGARPVIRDSAGVTIAENVAPAWGEGGWRIDPDPVVDIGVLEGEEVYQLFRVTGARRLSGGRIVVANSGTHELRFYGPDGRYEGASGREGGGPGEFRRLELLGLLAGDTIVTYDGSQERISIFGPDGRYVRAVPLTGSESSIVYRPLGMFADRSILVMQSLAFRPGDLPEGVNRTDTRFYHLDPEGAVLDTAGVFPGPEMYGRAVGTGFFMTALPFGRSPSAAVAADRFFFGNGSSYQITRYRQDGSPDMILRRVADGRPVTAEALEAVKAERLRDAPGDNWRRRYEVVFEEAPIAETMPAYRGFVLGDDGHLWVRAYELPGGATDGWTIFDPSGVMLGDVELPEGMRLLQAGADFVLGLWQDDLEVEHVRLFRLDRAVRMEGP